MQRLVIYIHGKGGSAAESAHYKPLFTGCKVMGLDYQGSVPWEAGPEIRRMLEQLYTDHTDITLIANSIGAFYSMIAGIDVWIRNAYLISPIVDMQKLILDMMASAGVTEEELKAKRVIRTAYGEELSWDYLCYVRTHPVQWAVPTEILYGSKDTLSSFETVAAFARKNRAGMTVMENGEHWFHTAEQMCFLDNWIKKCENAG